MSAKSPTQIRLEIARRITGSLVGIARGVMLGGSMGFGQNFSVTNDSDIDLVVLVERDKLEALQGSWYFKSAVHKDALRLFDAEKIDFFWVTRVVDGVEVNVFVYDPDAYTRFCLLEGGLVGFLTSRPGDTQTSYGFGGEQITFDRNVQPFGEGYTYERPGLVAGKYWGGVPRQDFIYSGEILYEQDRFLSMLESASWERLVKQMVREYGSDLDLNKVSVLNTHYTYRTARHRVPGHVVEQVRTRTNEELQKFKST